MRSVHIRSLLRAGFTAAAMLCLATATNAQSRPAVVELFTSEGCSSCPPAEAYIGDLARRADVLALAFHVDYWDDQGWRDRFSLPQATERQHIYAQNAHRPSVYTPEIVIDGREDYLGSDRRSVESALRARRSGVPVGISLRGDDVLIEVGPQDKASTGDVVVVPYLRKAVSAIGRGENAGRTLDEFNIVRSIQRLGRWDGRAQKFHVSLSSLPSDATDVAVLVQPLGQVSIVGAATHPLRN